MTIRQVVWTVFCIFYGASALPHGTDWAADHLLDWRTKEISRVSSSAPFSHEEPGTFLVDGKRCISGPFLNIDVRDEFAFDIDETVVVEIEFELQNSPSEIVLIYDRNGGLAEPIHIRLPAASDSRFYRKRFELARARFAGRPSLLHLHGDLAIAGARNGVLDTRIPVALCDIVITRSYNTSEPAAHGKLSINLLDERGRDVAARVGLYDQTGRMPLPSEGALLLTYKAYESRSISLGPTDRNSGLVWPSDNRFAFIIDGTYRADLPAGKYTFVAVRGIEYRHIRENVKIEAGEETRLNLTFRRWADMPARGWYSGDTHIHYGRSNDKEARDVLTLARAEDLHVSNLLQMGDVALLDFLQYNWGVEGQYGSAPYMLVPGQEDPRSQRGHTIQLNIDDPVRDPARYYQYHEVFEAVHEQGGITGYAHVRRLYSAGARLGLALDVPWGLVDFVEILSFGVLDTDTWFDWLNLGYRLTPAAGSDAVPLVGGLPGDVRNYVRLRGDHAVQAWFDGMKDGKTFVTNGPLLSLEINGRGIGDDLDVRRGEELVIIARATLNPDISSLHRLELYEQGDVVATATSDSGSAELLLNFSSKADAGTWFVLRASSEENAIGQQAVAITAPIYVRVEGSGFCKVDAVQEIARRQKAHLDQLRRSTLDSDGYEFPDAEQLRETYWPANRTLLLPRIAATHRKYDELIALAGRGECTKQ